MITIGIIEIMFSVYNLVVDFLIFGRIDATTIILICAGFLTIAGAVKVIFSFVCFNEPFCEIEILHFVVGFFYLPREIVICLYHF